MHDECLFLCRSRYPAKSNRESIRIYSHKQHLSLGITWQGMRNEKNTSKHRAHGKLLAVHARSAKPRQPLFDEIVIAILI
ncbi:hypothetical protein HU200_026708 [Digitaria exilis]|uniref:Uncharacterized protein n=1 Tax=Digitaria exilis TaxID=1010633 RepID=A0A835BYN4_9POAL|nr:hypothetical protein HU200_026708 [Digitaria exilis]